MPVETSIDRVLLKHPKGATTEILYYGATVISWKAAKHDNEEPTERLFVSSKAFLDGSKPIRGGIPVVFPCFGPPTHAEHNKLSQHGFARSETWLWDRVVMDNEAGVSIRLSLLPTPAIASKYVRPFRLTYVVTLGEHQLSTDLHVENTAVSGDDMEFQALLHNYLRAPSNLAVVTPLQNISYYDKTENDASGRTALKLESRSEVDVQKFTDSVYENAPPKCYLSWPEGRIEVKFTHFKDVVVWNPQEEGWKIGDMEPSGWERYVCVEPGYVTGFVKLPAGATWIGQQVLSIH